MSPSTVLSVIDIGTNSVKCEVVRVNAAGRVTKLAFARETTRIGAEVPRTGRLSAGGLRATIAAIKRFRRTARRHRPDREFALATWAFREARDAAAALARIKRETGLAVRVLSGREEARFAYLSARAELDLRRPHALIVDIGGGSAEFVHVEGGAVRSARSLPLGALALTERFIHSDPIDAADRRALEAHARKEVEGAVQRTGLAGVPPANVDLVISGGAATTLLKMIRGRGRGAATTSVALGDARDIARQAADLPLARRKRMPGLEPDRAGIIVAGIAVATATARALGKRVIYVARGGVRRGAVLHLMRNSLEWSR